MKSRYIAAIILALFFLPAVHAFDSTCEARSRDIGPFGAMDRQSESAVLSKDVARLLPQLHAVRQVFNTNLSPSGEDVIVYDSSAEDFDPKPRVAILVNGRIAKLFDTEELDPSGAGFEKYLGGCLFALTRNQKALAIAVSSAGDGTGSEFTIITWHSGAFRIEFKLSVAQGRLELSSQSLKVWDRVLGRNASRPESPHFECEWCPHRYVVTEYIWRNGRYAKAGSRRTKQMYDPADVSGPALVLMKERH
jgi:hypothetical protein